LERFVENFAKNSDILANKLRAVADGVTAHDITPYLIRCTLDVIVQTSSGVDSNIQNDNDDSTPNNIITVVDTSTIRAIKPWLLIDWIFKATELGKKYHKAVQTEHGKINNDIGKKKRMRENTQNRGQNEEKLSLMDILIQYEDISKEEIVGEIASIFVTILR
jgi:hypothetical protein